MNEIINKFLSRGDKFMSEVHLRQPGFTYSPCGLLTKIKKKRIKKWKQKQKKQEIQDIFIEAN